MQQGVQGDAVPLPEREVSSQHPLLFQGPPQAARERYLNSYLLQDIFKKLTYLAAKAWKVWRS